MTTTERVTDLVPTPDTSPVAIAPEYTADMITEPIGSPEELRDLFAKVQRREHVVAVEGSTVMWDGAILFGRGLASFVGEGKPFPSQNKYAAAYGISGGYATRLRRLSTIIARYGDTFGPGTPEWCWLTGNIQTAVGGVLVPDKKVPVASFRKQVRDYMTGSKALPGGKKKGPARKSTDPKKGDGGGTGTEATGDNKARALTFDTLGDFEDVLRTMAAHFHKLSNEDWATFESRLEAARTRQNGLRVAEATAARKAAAKAAKPAPPRK